MCCHQIPYYTTDALPAIWENKPLVPCVKINSLTNFDYEKVTLSYPDHKVFFTGEFQLYYCLTQNIPYLDMKQIGPWLSTRPITSKQFNSSFNESVDLLLPYKNLHPYNSLYLILTLSCVDNNMKIDKPIAATLIGLFNSHNIFRNGIYEVELHWMPLPNNLSILEHSQRLLDMCSKFGSAISSDSRFRQLNFLLKQRRRYYRGELQRTSLDQFSLSKLEERINLEMRNFQLDKSLPKTPSDSNCTTIFLSIEFFFAQNLECNLPIFYQKQAFSQQESESFQNPVEKKFVDLFRNPKLDRFDEDRKPKPDELDSLKRLLNQPINYLLKPNETELIWTFRFYLKRYHPKESLSKVVRSTLSQQDDRVKDMLKNWPSVSLEDLLEFFSKEYMKNSYGQMVRNFAVARLSQISDTERLELYLFQLVQSLRFESLSRMKSTEDFYRRVDFPKSTMAHSVVSGILDEERGSNSGEEEDDEAKTSPSLLNSSIKSVQSMSSFTFTSGNKPESGELVELDLATYLIERCLMDFRLANYFYWFLYVECHQQTKTDQACQIYNYVFQRFKTELEHKGWIEEFQKQECMIDAIRLNMENMNGTRQDREQNIKTCLKSANAGEKFGIQKPPVRFPLNPDFHVSGIDPDEVLVFKSAKRPLLLKLVSADSTFFKAIFKYGDDLRTDQLIMQFIKLMDHILKNEGLNLYLTPYQVLALNNVSGLIEFIPSMSICEIEKQYDSILNYFRKLHYSPQTTLKVKEEVMRAYIHSCAGYCIITYLLGVGDRHLDNILISPDGRLFHIDFGFIFGNDPKPMPSEIAINDKIIDGMGGENSQELREFYALFINVYLSLRRHANLFLTMLSLSLEAGIKDMFIEPNKMFDFFRDRFCLGMSDNDAITQLCRKFEESLNAVFPRIMQKFHDVVQAMRN